METIIIILAVLSMLLIALAVRHKRRIKALNTNLENDRKSYRRQVDYSEKVAEQLKTAEKSLTDYKQKVINLTNQVKELQKKKAYDRRCPHCKKYLKKDYDGKTCYHCNEEL